LDDEDAEGVAEDVAEDITEGVAEEDVAEEFKLASSSMMAVSVFCHMATNGVARTMTMVGVASASGP